MATVMFDTLTAADQLEAAGIESSQAKAIVGVMGTAFDDTVATKADITRLESATKADIAEVKADLKADMAELKAAFSNAINRMLMAQLVVAGLLFAALKLFD